MIKVFDTHSKSVTGYNSSYYIVDNGELKCLSTNKTIAFIEYVSSSNNTQLIYRLVSSAICSKI